MEIKQLRHFMAIAEAGSFTRGAEKAHLSQPAISASIQKLEEELGKPLFLRNKKQALLTPEGKSLKRSAELILDEVKAVRAQLAGNTRAVNLKLSVASNFPLPKLSPILSYLTQKIPDVSFSITDAAPDKVLTTLQKGAFDLAFSVTYRGDPLPQNWTAIALEDERYGVVVPAGHPFAGRKQIGLREIVDEPFIEVTKWEYRNSVIQRLKSERIKLTIRHRADQYSRALSLVEIGQGITIMPEGITPQGSAAEGLVFIPFDDPSMRRTLTLFVTPQAEQQLAGLLDFSLDFSRWLGWSVER